ncbi:hypothetical protein WS68_19370 [Burkholderia sp. TSV86]|nr:hypothetical protein WS68_19370 [Burkholderia sp. TSV86]
MDEHCAGRRECVWRGTGWMLVRHPASARSRDMAGSAPVARQSVRRSGGAARWQAPAERPFALAHFAAAADAGPAPMTRHRAQRSGGAT